MNLELRKFNRGYYHEYVSWFADPELNRRLGPMAGDEGKDWLQAVLTQPESEGEEWAVFLDTGLVAVVGTVFDPEGLLPPGITELAVKPDLRRKGIGAAVLQKVFSLHRSRGITQHLAYIHVDNDAGRKCAEKAGFAAVGATPDKHGYVEFRSG